MVRKSSYLLIILIALLAGAVLFPKEKTDASAKLAADTELSGFQILRGHESPILDIVHWPKNVALEGSDVRRQGNIHYEVYDQAGKLYNVYSSYDDAKNEAWDIKGSYIKVNGQNEILWKSSGKFVLYENGKFMGEFSYLQDAVNKADRLDQNHLLKVVDFHNRATIHWQNKI